MSIHDDPIERQKPEADLQEQMRAETEEPDDPETAVADGPLTEVEADPADAAEQRREVPFDDERWDGGAAADAVS